MRFGTKHSIVDVKVREPMDFDSCPRAGAERHRESWTNWEQQRRHVM